MQNNVPSGLRLRRTAGADLSAKENFIVMLDGSDEIQLHDGSVKTPYLLTENTDDAAEGTIEALDPTVPVRVKTAGAHVIHAPVYLDISTGKATPTASAIRLGFALETKDSGEGDVLIRPAVAIQPVTTLAAIAGTLTGTVDGTINDVAGAAGACGGGATPANTDVDTAIATAIAPLVTSTNLALKEIVTVLNSLIALVKKAN